MTIREWFKDAKRRLVVTVTGGLALIVGGGVSFGWWGALAVLAGEVLLCVIYSVWKLVWKWLEKRKAA